MKNSSSIDNKVVIVFGSHGGIGKALVKQFRVEKSRVVGVYRSNERVDSHVPCNDNANDKSSFCEYPCDISDENQVSNLFNKILMKFKTIDIVINAAGTFFESLVENTSVQDWHRVINDNLLGTFLVCKYCVPIMKRNNDGSIFLFSSVGGVKGLKGKSVYSASKIWYYGFFSVFTEGSEAQWNSCSISMSLFS